jgi:hypothetical protein
MSIIRKDGFEVPCSCTHYLFVPFNNIEQIFMYLAMIKMSLWTSNYLSIHP